MGFLEKIFGKKGNNSSNKELAGSVILELDKMQQRALQIGIVLSDEKQVELENKIEEFRNFIKNNSVDDVELQNSFNNLKKEFELQLKELGQIYLFQEIENLSKKLYKRCFGDATKEQEEKETLGFLESKYNSLCERIDEFDGIKRELYARELTKAKYRMRLYKSIEGKSSSEEIFKDCPEEEIIVFSTLLMGDVQTLYEYLDKISYKFKFENEGFAEFDILKQNVDSLVRRMDVEYSRETNFNELLRDFGFMNSFLYIFSRIRLFNRDTDIYISNIKEARAKEEEEKRIEEKRKEEEKQRLEKDKNIQEEEMRKEIKSIDDNSFDVTDNYKDIMNYEKRIARAKGLLNPKSEISTDDLTYIRIAKDEVGMYIMEAEKQELSYTILYDVDDNSEQDCLVIISKKDEKKVNIQISDDDLPSVYKSTLRGIYGKSFIDFCRKGECYYIKFVRKKGIFK